MRKSPGHKMMDKALLKMFDAVGLGDWTIDDIMRFAAKHPDDWFRRHSWTEEQEERFRKWMRHRIKQVLRLTDRQALYETNMFLLNYGWTTGPAITDADETTTYEEKETQDVHEEDPDQQAEVPCGEVQSGPGLRDEAVPDGGGEEVPEVRPEL